MNNLIIWLFVFIALYWIYCMQWAISSSRLEQGPIDFFLSNRRLPAWVFVLFATGASFSGWAIIGYPSLVMRDGLSFAQLALASIAIPLTGVLFMKRQWLLSQHFGFLTPGEMLTDYFGGNALRIIVIIIALICAVPFVGMSISATGYLIQWVSNGVLPASIAMWVLTMMVFLYVCIGGMRVVAYVGSLQGLLMCAGILSVGIIAIWLWSDVGSFNHFMQSLAKLGETSLGLWGSSAQGYNAFLHIPGIVQFTAGLGQEDPVAGIWTTSMILSTTFALMGIQASPAFSMLAFSCRNAKGFAPQQVWASAAGVGLLLIFFSLIQGLGSHFLGATAEFHESGLTLSSALQKLNQGNEGQLYTNYLRALVESSPWFTVLLAICALAAIHAMISLFTATAGTIIVRDAFIPYLTPKASLEQQKLYARCSIAAIFFVALLLSTFAPSAQVQLGTLALGFTFQLWPSLLGVCWFPWITRQGATVGLVAGLLTVVLTEQLGATLCRFFGFELPWGRWPWTIHSAGWGGFVNVLSCIVVSWISSNKHDRKHRMKYHNVFAKLLTIPSNQRFLHPVAWSLTLIWFFFAVGPGAILGNDFFGAPNTGLQSWLLGVPSLWAWQMIWWALGILVIWFLAYRIQLSTQPKTDIFMKEHL